MKFINELAQNTLLVKIISSIIVIIVIALVYIAFTNFLSSRMKKYDLEVLNNKKGKTYLKMLKNIGKYILIIIAVLTILHIFGIDVSSMIAGVGIISIIIGFAVQDALKDIIKGFDIISDNFYNVGDVIKYEGITGKVLNIGLKTTKVMDILSLNIVSISNRNIEKVEIVSNLINIDVPLPYEIEISKAETVLEEIVTKIKQQKEVENCEYRGVSDLDESAIKYQIKVYCSPVQKPQIKRDALRTVLLVLSEHKISVPYNQLDIHQK